MSIRISMTIPNSVSGNGKFGIVLPDDVASAAAGDLVANTLRILRDEIDAPDKSIVQMGLDAAGITHKGEYAVPGVNKKGVTVTQRFDQEYPDVDFGRIKNGDWPAQPDESVYDPNSGTYVE